MIFYYSCIILLFSYLCLGLCCDFHSRNSYTSAVLTVVILSVCLCLSVRLSVTRGLCDKSKQRICRWFDITRKGNHSSFLKPTMVGRRRPLPSKICAESDPPLRKTPTSTDFRL